MYCVSRAVCRVLCAVCLQGRPQARCGGRPNRFRGRHGAAGQAGDQEAPGRWPDTHTTTHHNPFPPNGISATSSQLDGETNLKLRKAPVQTGHLSLKSLSELKGTLQCEVPHHVMYSFKGTLHLDSESQAIPLDNQQLLLQSSFLRNTDWAVGIIAYAVPRPS
jgi:hypothetical protein